MLHVHACHYIYTKSLSLSNKLMIYHQNTTNSLNDYLLVVAMNSRTAPEENTRQWILRSAFINIHLGMHICSCRLSNFQKPFSLCVCVCVSSSRAYTCLFLNVSNAHWTTICSAYFQSCSSHISQCSPSFSRSLPLGLIDIFRWKFSSIWNFAVYILLRHIRSFVRSLCLHRNRAKVGRTFHLNDCIRTHRNLLNKHIVLKHHWSSFIRWHVQSLCTKEEKKVIFEKLHQIKSIIALKINGIRFSIIIIIIDGSNEYGRQRRWW